jgi:glucosamine-6-phosphate deaminase
MPPVYASLARLFGEGQLSFSQVVTFNLDEYVGLPSEHAGSYRAFMQQELFSKADFTPGQTHLPDGMAENAIEEADRYEALIAALGPIDLQLLGIGSNGHIGFNEPTSSLGSRTRLKTLTLATRQANRQYFSADDTPPHLATTVGIRTILEIILLATGERKAPAVAAMIEGPVSAICPASALQMHPGVTVILDDAAASSLKLRDYYFQVHPNGDEVAAG